MNLGDAFKRPMSDPEWIKKCAMTGIMLLIPLVGGFAVIGWSQRYFEGLSQGESNLPDPFGDVVGDIVRGLKLGISMVISMLPLLLLFFCAGAFPPILGAIDDDLAIVGVGLMALILIPTSLLTIAWAPAAEIAHRSTGNVVAFSAIGPVLGRARQNIMGYIMLIIGVVVAQIIGQLGVIACVIGVFVTLPLGLAMRVSLINSWQSEG